MRKILSALLVASALAACSFPALATTKKSAIDDSKSLRCENPDCTPTGSGSSSSRLPSK